MKLEHAHERRLRAAQPSSDFIGPHADGNEVPAVEQLLRFDLRNHFITPRGFAPRTPLQALSRATPPARSGRLARFAVPARVVITPLHRRSRGPFAPLRSCGSLAPFVRILLRSVLPRRSTG